MSDPADNVEITMDDAAIERLLAVCGAATPAPWDARDDGDGDGSVFNLDGVRIVYASAHDAAFIAEARTALPAALKALREARALLRDVDVWQRDVQELMPDGMRARIDAVLGSRE